MIDESAERTAAEEDEHLTHETYEREFSWHDLVAQAVEVSDRRIDQWIVEQRRRIADGVDNLLLGLERRRQDELAKIEEWKTDERRRFEDELALEREDFEAGLVAERERFHARMLEELMAFEEQLALRLQEHEERLARWWEEAEEISAARFAALELARREAEAPVGEEAVSEEAEEPVAQPVNPS